MTDPISTARPTTVTAAFWLWVAASLVGVIGGIIILAFAGDAPAIQRLDESQRAAAGAVIIGLGAWSIIVAALRVLFAWFMLRGRNWARILLTVLGALTILSVVFQAASVGVLEWISAVLVAAAIVFMYLPASRAYFAATRRPRV
ncbi:MULTISPECIES: hypothetical protein [unclassified Microbacterium]|uniref:hypothetical protein n=1 Tax=unclassified Microbacterium TaxID=2609290 RepID=UPI0037477A7A